MAILNITPDSFSDGGQLEGNLSIVLAAARNALSAGAQILDIGGESTRPGAITVDPEVEMARVLPVIAALHREMPEAILSIDTRKASVAEAALQAGAQIVNDVSGLQFDDRMAETVARHQAQIIIMHSQGNPQTMQRNPQYPQGVMPELLLFFERQIDVALQAGILRENIVLDPGFGFGKTLAQNLSLLNQLDALQTFRIPILVGTSRKSFLTLGQKTIDTHEREALTAATLTLALEKGASWFRVHDVKTQAPVLRLVEAVMAAQSTYQQM